jgi:hypothetical protein
MGVRRQENQMAPLSGGVGVSIKTKDKSKKTKVFFWTLGFSSVQLLFKLRALPAEALAKAGHSVFKFFFRP